jgi:hypothetical protein
MEIGVERNGQGGKVVSVELRDGRWERGELHQMSNQ